MLLLDEPTRGIDLAAKAEIYALLRRLAADGFGIVLCSSEMSEILTQCHRVLVFREGRVAGELPREEATEERILAAAAGTAAASACEIPGGPRAESRLRRRRGRRSATRAGASPYDASSAWPPSSCSRSSSRRSAADGPSSWTSGT